ncbi:arsenic transporter [Endozoicomonas sp. SM1973]|uniref:Arsenic transporter n=1 Tax=Spartinivicinus marinus TaxID=2994442 RepID=A0A853I7M4_9GAMM|nr:SLC13 family permease [Spartinivicinus marinus]MCX4029606.1 SLC13 family permease [Spartinivicinus marinus]NYZ68819.1 arsenic transporter [Spartinivicinus marinus]
MINHLTEPMLVSGFILILTFFGIFTENFHGIERAKFAMAGAGSIIIAGQFYGFYSPQLAVHAIDWNVVFLLAIMMIIVAIMISTGGFEYLAHYLAQQSKGSQYRLVIMLGTAVTVISLLLDNVTTVIIFGPLIILISRTMGVSPIPYLLAAALLSDTGGVATLVGDPPNLMIGSAAGISFNTFIIHMGPPVLLAWVGILIALRYLFANELSANVKHQFDHEVKYKNKSLWQKCIFVMGVMVVLFILHHTIGWEPWLVAAACLTLLLFLAKHIELEQVTNYLETPLLIFFISLFIMIGGVEKSGLLEVVGQTFKPLIIESPLIAALVLLWVAAILSALIDNIPFTAAMIPVLAGLQTEGVNVSVMWWTLAMGVGMGGNGSHIGSTANVYIVTISERLARDTGNPQLAITPGLWVRKGTPAMIITLLLCSLFLVVGYDFLYIDLT